MNLIIINIPVFVSLRAVSGTIKSRKLFKVSRFKSVVIAEDGAHHAGPWLPEYEITLAFTLNLLARFVKQRRDDAEKGKRRRTRLHRSGAWKGEEK